MLSTIFCAVPDFIRVEPVSASGPTTGTMAISAAFVIGESGTQVIQAVKQPSSRAYSIAPMVYGVRPEAASPMTASVLFTPRCLRSSPPACLLSSLASVALYKSFVAAGDHALDQFVRNAKCRRNFRCIEHSQPPACSGSDIKKPAAVLQAVQRRDRPSRRSRAKPFQLPQPRLVFIVDQAEASRSKPYRSTQSSDFPAR